ncbi:MAG: hypothetical protein ACI8S6_001803 [Myxococcota bacterium]|jgi:hypothetical protein
MTTWQYMTRFACLGGDCEDTCCASWGVEVSEDAAARIEEAVGEPRTREMIAFYAEQHRTPERCGRIRMPAYQTCTMLNGQGMCSLQMDHGEAVLPRTCVSYPRSLSHHGTHQELGGFLSCPEVARQALLKDDALEAVDAPLPEMRMNPDQTIDREGAYFDLRAEVSAALSELGRGRPLAERLWLLSRLGAMSVARFSRSTTDPAPIRALLTEFQDTGYQDAIVSELADSTRPTFDDALLGALRILGEDIGRYLKPRAHVAAALATIDSEGLEAGRERWPALETTLSGALDNYIRFHFLSRWYTESPDLGSHIENMLLKLALLRLLLRTAPADTPPDEVLITAVYSIDRMVEHDAWRFQCKALVRAAGGDYFTQLGDWIRF